VGNIRIAICDDEKNIRDCLCALVRGQDIKCEITEYASAEEYLSDGREHDILFLDIEMGRSESHINGMELAERIRGGDAVRQPVIIFVTGYEDYVYDAFDVGAFQYLLKPVSPVKFAKVFRRAVQTRLDENRRNKTLTVRYAGITKTIALDQIYYMESQNHKIVIHLRDGELAYYARIGDLEEELQGQFFRIHKGFLINLAFVEEYSKTEVTMTSGDRIPISKYKYQDFTKAYLRFMQ
jgi:Response regulator of the LytR/AlgR family